MVAYDPLRNRVAGLHLLLNAHWQGQACPLARCAEDILEECFVDAGALVFVGQALPDASSFDILDSILKLVRKQDDAAWPKRTFGTCIIVLFFISANVCFTIGGDEREI